MKFNETDLRNLGYTRQADGTWAKVDPADTVGTEKPKRMDRQEVRQAPTDGAMGAGHCLRRVSVVFRATNGRVRLDNDNREYVVKPILDALKNLGCCDDDQEIKSKVEQRMDGDHA